MYKESDFTWLSPRKVDGESILEARTRAGLNQQELADRAAVKKRQVQRWENGISKPSKASMEKLDALFGKSWTK